MKRKVNNDSLRRRKRRAFSIRKKLEGSGVRPRLTVFRSNQHIYAQIIDDRGVDLNKGRRSGKTLASASSRTAAVKADLSGLKKSEAAELVGKAVAEQAKAAGVTTVIFDRNGYPYHGRVAALAKGAREAGLKF